MPLRHVQKHLARSIFSLPTPQPPCPKQTSTFPPPSFSLRFNPPPLTLPTLPSWKPTIYHPTSLRFPPYAYKNPLSPLSPTKTDGLLLLQSRFLADRANQYSREGDAGTAMLLALEALPDIRDGMQRPPAEEADVALFRAYQRLQETIVLKGHKGSIWSAAFTMDGRRVVTASDDDTARVWDAENGNQLVVLQGHNESVRFAAFSPDGRQVITASADNTARVVGSGKRKAVRPPPGAWRRGAPQRAAFSPDGRRVLTDPMTTLPAFGTLGRVSRGSSFRGTMGQCGAQRSAPWPAHHNSIR